MKILCFDLQFQFWYVIVKIAFVDIDSTILVIHAYCINSYTHIHTFTYVVENAHVSKKVSQCDFHLHGHNGCFFYDMKCVYRLEARWKQRRFLCQTWECSMNRKFDRRRRKKIENENHGIIYYLKSEKD